MTIEEAAMPSDTLQQRSISIDCNVIDTLETHVGKRLQIVLAACACVFLVACNRNQGVTRSSAKEVMNHSARFTPAVPRLELTATELQCGTKEGLWAKSSRNRNLMTSLFGPQMRITARGKAAFKSLSLSHLDRYAARAVLNGTYGRTVLEVTGITNYAPPLEGWTGKEAQFTWRWNWNEFPDAAKQCISPPRDEKGTAMFRHYDDGWRVEEVVTPTAQ